MNYGSIAYVAGTLLLVTGGAMILPVVCASYFQEGDLFALAISMVILCTVGLPLRLRFAAEKDLGMREALVIAVFGWVGISAVSTLPYLIHGSIPSFTDAFFEMMSGYTTTGATILDDIEALPHGLLFWRSETHLLGGMGFLTLAILFLPHGMGGLRIFRAESSPGQVITRERFTARNRDAIRYLWILYLVLNLAQILLLMLGGMSLFDAACHAFGTVSTSGYSPYNASVAAFGSAYVDWVITIFMFLGGTTFMLFFYLVRGDWRVLRVNTELPLVPGHHGIPVRGCNARHLARTELRLSRFVALRHVSGGVSADHHRFHHDGLRAVASGGPDVPFCGLLHRGLCRVYHQWYQDHSLRAHQQVHGCRRQEDLLSAACRFDGLGERQARRTDDGVPGDLLLHRQHLLDSGRRLRPDPG